ncbi:aminopeptidase N [Marinivivus vitaminiproducens]|uniref:aminopeptidase N n=1 Tax=Marinivivus vitaminiproducens TaxID=3035935 RepID=UPI00279A46C8|nr:aminopeptidase N [Geminicoccaceae bacterium SCSIO 64248]
MANDAAPQVIRREDYRPPAFLIEQVELGFVLEPSATRVTSRLHLRRNPEAGTPDAPLVLDGQALTLDGIALDGREIAADAYAVDDESLTVAAMPDTGVLEVRTTIDPKANTALEGLYLSNGVFCTQCEAEGFRRITYFPDRPDVMTRYTVRIEADKAACPVMLSNGNPIDRGELGGGRHFAVWQDPHPKPCYLFALVAGDLGVVRDGFTTRSGRKVDLRIYTEHDKVDQCDHAMVSLKKSMKWDEDVFGLEYDLDIFMIVAVSDFNMGAMENKGLNIFNTKYILAKPETATDADYQGIERVVAHEYFHNWTGDRVTCRDWFQLTLKEGLTVFRDQQFSGDMNDAAVQRITDVRRLRSAQFPEDAGPLAHPIRPDSYIEINNFYTTTVYEKGAEVIRMIHTLIGPKNFRRGMDLYFERFDNQAVTCEDFVKAMEDASGRDLGQFRRWYAQAGTPRIEARGRHDETGRRYTLTLRQTCPPTPGQPEKEPFHLPVALGLLDPAGQPVPLRLEGENTEGATSRVLDLTELEQTFVFENVPSAPVPSLLRGFSAPAILDAGYRDAELRHLLAHDTDPFARWEAGQTLALHVMLALIADAQAGRPLALSPGVIEAFGEVLDDQAVAPAFKAQMLALPAQSYLGEQMAVIDPDAVLAVHRFVRKALADALRPHFRTLYDAMTGEARAFSVDADAIGRRSLALTALGYLSAGGNEDGMVLVLDLLAKRATMTEVIAALAILSETERPERTEAFEAFHAKWRHDALVTDKWFGLQAMAQVSDSVERTEALLRHPDYVATNPNRVRSVLGAFAAGNPTGFHREDGKGYALVGREIRELDGMNPQVAARMTQSFGRWRRYDAGRQERMQAELRAILAKPGLSRDVREIAQKSLEG